MSMGIKRYLLLGGLGLSAGAALLSGWSGGFRWPIEHSDAAMISTLQTRAEAKSVTQVKDSSAASQSMHLPMASHTASAELCSGVAQAYAHTQGSTHTHTRAGADSGAFSSTDKTKTCGQNNRTSTSADASEDCTTPQTLDKYRLARRLSLDLRGFPPTYEEYQQLDALDEVPENWVDAYISSDAYRLQMRRYHESLLWTNPSGAQLVDINIRLVPVRTQTEAGQVELWAILGNGRRNLYRGNQQAICGNYEQTEYKSDGTPVTRTVTDANGNTYQQDGYVPVKPYWDPSLTLKVCAFEAQTAARGLRAACDTRDGKNDIACGCGPELRWCFGQTTQNEVWVSMREQVGRAIDKVTTGQTPYTDLLLGTQIDYDGKLEFWHQHLSNMVAVNRLVPDQGPGDASLPAEPNYRDTSWRTYERSGQHAGILTMPGYSLRFMTNRARANRFRIAFTGQYFVPPSQTENPATDGCAESSGDLTQQCTCRSCHQVLEPLAAHFGVVAEAGSRLMSDFAPYNAGCDPRADADGNLPASCARFYETNPSALNPGWLYTHQYAMLEQGNHVNTGLDDALHRAIAANLASGPAGLAEEVISTGQLAPTTVSYLFEHLMRRPLDLDPSSSTSELSLLNTLSAEFAEDYDFKKLVRRMVLLPQYRRVGP
ncbi:MAG: hypothetical protein ACKO6N_25680 [Myxococcota bacterium]